MPADPLAPFSIYRVQVPWLAYAATLLTAAAMACLSSPVGALLITSLSERWRSLSLSPGPNPTEVYSHLLAVVLSVGMASTIAWTHWLQGASELDEQCLRRVRFRGVAVLLVTAFVLDLRFGEGAVFVPALVLYAPFGALLALSVHGVGRLRRWQRIGPLLVLISGTATATLRAIAGSPDEEQLLPALALTLAVAALLAQGLRLGSLRR